MRSVVVAGLAAALTLAGAPAQAVETRSCGWFIQVSGDQLNVLYPDEAATYWGARVSIPKGGHVELKGDFPKARYASLITYTSPDLSAIDILRDSDIAPDAGSKNPFRPGAKRDVRKRSFTLRVVDGRVPAAGRARNTLYTDNGAGKKNPGTAQIIWRVYLPDLGLGASGGVPLPDIAVVQPSGKRIDYPRCPDTGVPNLGLTEAIAGLGLGLPLPVLNLTNRPVWHKYVGGGAELVSATDNAITGTTLYPLLRKLTPHESQGGFGDTPDNRYVYVVLGADYGQVFAFRARAPTFPRTRATKRMGGGEVRYWSVCTNLVTTMYIACAPDEEIPVDADGSYTVVISTAAARPRNATTTCGVTWLPVGPALQTVVAMRHLLPAKSFTQSTHAARLGSEREDMGPYYPGGRYYARNADFERLGCPVAEAAR